MEEEFIIPKFSAPKLIRDEGALNLNAARQHFDTINKVAQDKFNKILDEMPEVGDSDWDNDDPEFDPYGEMYMELSKAILLNNITNNRKD